ncbi:MAG: prolyl oligopeptidase family serine peptidase [Halobacteriaceae archaeon]
MAGLDADAYYDLTQITDIAVSPSGDRVAFVASEQDPDEDRSRSSVFVVPTDGSATPHRLTRASDASSPTWGPAGEQLAVLAARDTDPALVVGRDADDEDETDDEDGSSGDDSPEQQVWLFDLARGGDARQLTEREHGVSELAWDPDGDRLVYAARDPTEDEEEYLDRVEDDGPIEIDRLQHKADGTDWLDTVTTYLFVIDVDTRDAKRLDEAFDAPDGARFPQLSPTWSPDGERIAFVSQLAFDDPDDTLASDVFTIAPDGSERVRLTEGEHRIGPPDWSPSGDRLAFSAGHPTNWYRPTEVHVANRDGSDQHSVSGSLDRTLGFGGQPTWLDSDRLIALIGDEGLTRPVVLDAATDDPDRVLPAQGRDRTLPAFDVDGEMLVGLLSDPGEGRDLYAVPVADLETESPDALTRLTAVNGEFTEQTEAPRSQRLSWENDDGVTVEGIVYMPSDFDPADPEPRPTVTAIHGGPMSYDSPAFSFDYWYWTSNGYIVLRPNYRGSTSYGREFSESLRGTRGDLESDDVLSGVDALLDRGWADPDRLFVTGFSYGGITTAHLVTRTDRFSAAAAEHGIYDFRATFGTDDNHVWHEDEFGLPWENDETYRDISSITGVGDVETPTLLTAGERDWRCPPTQAEQFYVSLQKRDVDSKLVVYQGEHHNIGDPDRAIHRLETLHEWFEEHDPAVDG